MTDGSATAVLWERLWVEGERSLGWSHSGIACDGDKRIVFAHPDGGALVMLAHDGAVAAYVPLTLTEIHGIFLDPTDGATLWLADPGEKPRPELHYRAERRLGRAVAFANGIEHDLRQPELPAYLGAPWRPTSVVADGEGVWVADGYGAGLVHRFTSCGRWLFALDGAETGEAFDCPHGIIVDERGTEPLLTVADRGHRRLVRFHLDGRLHSTLTDPLFTSPSCLAPRGDDLVVTELHGGLVAVDRQDTVRSLLPELAPSVRREPWPNARTDGRLHRPELAARRLHSPHGVAVDAEGAILLTEWFIGGRQWRLRLSE